jgi:hypothetical protein
MGVSKVFCDSPIKKVHCAKKEKKNLDSFCQIVIVYFTPNDLVAPFEFIFLKKNYIYIYIGSDHQAKHCELVNLSLFQP